jgi:1-acyl-sn-glycerol-3-phosphate acyltransferase
MMEHFNMKRFGFFRRIGAFSVDRTDPTSVRASIVYAAELLARPRAGLWLFPQGRMAPVDERPLGFQGGLRALLRQAGRLRVVPVALRFGFWFDERPEAFARFGEPEVFGRDRLAQILPVCEARLTAELDRLSADVATHAADRFEVLLDGSSSISDRFARWHARVFGTTPGAPPLDPS